MKKNAFRVHYGRAVFGREEIAAVVNVLKNPLRIGPGEKVREFESKVAMLFGKKYGVMVNSGSSANLLALASLKLPKGAEVITPVLTFGTTLAPIIQLGLTPVFADVTPNTYLMDLDQVESLITKKTRAIMIPSLLGNIPDMKRLQSIGKKHSLYIIEDSADTLGGRFDGKPSGHYSHISTTSFYASHIVTAAATGGMVCFHDKELAERALILSSWGRQSTLFGVNEKSEDIKKRFAGRIEGKIYDAKFVFTDIGYNMQSTDIAAAFGLVQLKKLKQFTQVRESHFSRLMQFFSKYDQFLSLPVVDRRVKTTWLAFPLTLTKDAPFTRAEITKFLEERGIQTRPVFTGNVLRQPAFKNIKYRGLKSYPVADYVMQNSFVIGCNHGLSSAELSYVEKAFERFLQVYT